MRQVGEAGPRREWWTTDFKFSWAPSGKAIYFERTSRAARNIWRMSVDPQTLRAGAIERLTTGPGLDTELSLSCRRKETRLYRVNPDVSVRGCFRSTRPGDGCPGRAML